MSEQNNETQNKDIKLEQDPVETMRERGLRKLRELQKPLFDSAHFHSQMHPLHGAFVKEK